jgi:hypothetical protein
MKFLPAGIITAGLLSLLMMARQITAQQTGHITYTLNRAANPTADQQDAYTRITAAMDAATTYYNTYTSITKHLSVNYVPDVPTADASFNGTVRFGQNRTYMVVLTALHETAHTVGIGTTNEYKNLIVNGVFTGAGGTAMLREVIGDPAAVLKGDAQHFWPYGLNYASEYKSDDDYVFHCKIVGAMYQDMFQESLFRTCYLRSVSDGRYIAASSDNRLVLREKADSSCVVRLIALADTTTFRLEFDDQVLDIPDESTAAGVAAGLWTWNGGAHQQVKFEFDRNATDPPVVRIQMVHSGLYLLPDGDRIVQERADAASTAQQWELVDKGKTLTGQRLAVALQPNTAEGYTITSAFLTVSAGKSNQARLLITDLSGRPVIAQLVTGTAAVNTAALAPGMYVVLVRRDGVNRYGRFMVP